MGRQNVTCTPFDVIHGYRKTKHGEGCDHVTEMARLLHRKLSTGHAKNVIIL